MLAESFEEEKKLGRLQRENFRKADQASAKIAFGTDAGSLIRTGITPGNLPPWWNA
jgi:imidazolonepropionase-like amidohydrolase